MTLKQKLAALKEQAASLASKIEEGDEEAIKQAEDVLKQIDETEKAIAAAEKSRDMLDRIGALNASKSAAVEVSVKDAPSSLGDWAVSRVKSFDVGKGTRMSMPLGTFTKAAAPMTSPSSLSDLTTYFDPNIYENVRRRLTIADLLGSETTSNSAVTYFVESSTVEGGFATVAEGATKPMLSFGDPTSVTESVKKIAGYYKESDELLTDMPRLATSINNRAIYLLMLQEEDQLLNGDGTGTNLTGILNRSGIQAEAVATGESNAADAIFRAMTLVSLNSPFAPDGIVINPTDYQTLRLTKDSSGQYFGGGFFQGQYGNGEISEQPPIWGLRTVVTSAIAQGTCLVGAFSLGGSILRRQGLTMDIANTNENDFINNRITIRLEERLALAIRYPSAFVSVATTATA